MNSSSSFNRIAALGLSLAFAVAISSRAGAAENEQTTTAHIGKKKAAVGVPATPGANTIGLLDEAYGLLRRADHDYHGHRAHAMHAIEAAARELGQKLGGGGKGDETQPTSDSQLHGAQGLLQQAAGGLTGKPLRHVQEALKQLGIALSIK
jgi:hypothetical protein